MYTRVRRKNSPRSMGAEGLGRTVLYGGVVCIVTGVDTHTRRSPDT